MEVRSCASVSVLKCVRVVVCARYGDALVRCSRWSRCVGRRTRSWAAATATSSWTSRKCSCSWRRGRAVCTTVDHSRLLRSRSSTLNCPRTRCPWRPRLPPLPPPSTTCLPSVLHQRPMVRFHYVNIDDFNGSYAHIYLTLSKMLLQFSK